MNGEGRADQPISAGEAADYLKERGLLPPDCPVVVEELGGGVSSTVLRARGCDRCLVLKQALPRLRVRDDWTASVERALVEARAAAALARLLPPAAILPPLYADPQRYLFVMACAPSGAETWKAKLLRGEAVPATAERAGVLLGWLHGRSYDDRSLAETFADREYFLSLRVAPYLHTTAERRPELRAAIQRHTERLLATAVCLVHGDYSPKNLLVSPADPADVIVLDHEVAHWGDPAFDLAFCLTHLHLKAVALPAWAAVYLGFARTFWQAYLAAAGPQQAATLERHAVGLLGCLIAARVDGKSPVEYLATDDQREAARRLARTILLDDMATFAEAGEATRASIL